ncbi:MAG TPA: hypothetical protein PKD12_15395 [Nitrospira sp.]|nr:hypothetical protein [Nitrospira sp.]
MLCRFRLRFDPGLSRLRYLFELLKGFLCSGGWKSESVGSECLTYLVELWNNVVHVVQDSPVCRLKAGMATVASGQATSKPPKHASPMMIMLVREYMVYRLVRVKVYSYYCKPSQGYRNSLDYPTCGSNGFCWVLLRPPHTILVNKGVLLASLSR